MDQGLLLALIADVQRRDQVLVGVVDLVVVVGRRVVMGRRACDRVRSLNGVTSGIWTGLSQGVITRHHVSHVVEGLDDVLEGLALRIGAQGGRVDVGRGTRLLRHVVHLMRDILTLESVWCCSLEKIVALLKDRALDAFASDSINNQLVVSSLRAVSLMVSKVALATGDLLLRPTDILHALAHLLFSDANWIRHRQGVPRYSLLHIETVGRRLVWSRHAWHHGLRAAVLDVLESRVRHPRHEDVLVRLQPLMKCRMLY